jgi:cyclase
MAVISMSRVTSRRELLKAGGWMAGAGLLSSLLPKNTLASTSAQQAAAPAADVVAQMRAQMGAVPLQTMKLRDDLFMLYGPGGNMVALNGPDGKVLVDSSFAPVVPKIREALDSMGNAPLKIVINSHWHLDHTDGNQGLHEAGALIVAHENTRKRLSTPQFMAALGLHFDAAPAAAWPQQTFTDNTALYFNG